jgi:hypothetical protein
MTSKYLNSQEHVLRISACLRLMEIAAETLIVYQQTYHSFSQIDQIFFDNCMQLVKHTRHTSTTMRNIINLSNVHSAIYLVNTSIKQFQIMFEPTLTMGTSNSEYVNNFDSIDNRQ